MALTLRGGGALAGVYAQHAISPEPARLRDWRRASASPSRRWLPGTMGAASTPPLPCTAGAGAGCRPQARCVGDLEC